MKTKHPHNTIQRRIVHNVQVYPIYAGHINDHKILIEFEYDTVELAEAYIEKFNSNPDMKNIAIAVYTGMIDDETGENL
jgi:hypothetical protein